MWFWTIYPLNWFWSSSSNLALLGIFGFPGFWTICIAVHILLKLFWSLRLSKGLLILSSKIMVIARSACRLMLETFCTLSVNIVLVLAYACQCLHTTHKHTTYHLHNVQKILPKNFSGWLLIDCPKNIYRCFCSDHIPIPYITCPLQWAWHSCLARGNT